LLFQDLHDTEGAGVRLVLVATAEGEGFDEGADVDVWLSWGEGLGREDAEFDVMEDNEREVEGCWMIIDETALLGEAVVVEDGALLVDTESDAEKIR